MSRIRLNSWLHKRFLAGASPHLEGNGWEHMREAKGDHVIWWHPETGRTLTIDKGTKSRHTVNAILKDAGLPKAF